MMTSKLLTLTHCMHTEIFLKEVGIISSEVNVTFDEIDEVLQYDLENAPEQLGLNKNWKSQNQVTIDQKKKQLK